MRASDRGWSVLPDGKLADEASAELIICDLVTPFEIDNRSFEDFGLCIGLAKGVIIGGYGRRH